MTMLCILSIFIFKLSHVISINTYTSNATYWKSLSSFIPSRNSSYGNITLHKSVAMEFNFIYYGKKTNEQEYENIFRIGYGGSNTCPQAGTRYPAMWVHPKKHQFQITMSIDASKCWDNNSPWITIQKFHTYHISIRFNQTHRYASIHNGTATHIFINELKSESFEPNPLLYTSMNVWISTEHAFSANVTLSNITFKTWDPITSDPTNSPTLIPTISPTNPTQFPSLTPTNQPTENVTSLSTRNLRTSAIIAIVLVAVFVFVICCFLFYYGKRYNLKMHNSLSPSLHIANKNSKIVLDENEEDIIFGKIYETQVQLNIETQKQRNENNNNEGDHMDILLPHEDSLETLSVLSQTNVATITAPTHQLPMLLETDDQYN